MDVGLQNIWDDTHLRCDVEDGVAHVYLLQSRMAWGCVNALISLAEALGSRADIRVVTVESTHSDFCHGIDLADPLLFAAVAEDQGRSVSDAGARLVEAWASLPVPTIAVIQGFTIGAGACLAFACDFRVAHPTARIIFPEIDRGMHLAWGIIPRLVSECGVGLTRRLALLGEPVQADVFPDSCFCLSEDVADTTASLVRTLRAKPPVAFRGIKAVIHDATWPGIAKKLSDSDHFVESIGSAEFAAAMAAWLDRR